MELLYETLSSDVGLDQTFVELPGIRLVVPPLVGSVLALASVGISNTTGGTRVYQLQVRLNGVVVAGGSAQLSLANNIRGVLTVPVVVDVIEGDVLTVAMLVTFSAVGSVVVAAESRVVYGLL